MGGCVYCRCMEWNGLGERGGLALGRGGGVDIE